MSAASSRTFFLFSPFFRNPSPNSSSFTGSRDPFPPCMMARMPFPPHSAPRAGPTRSPAPSPRPEDVKVRRELDFTRRIPRCLLEIDDQLVRLRLSLRREMNLADDLLISA